MDVDYQIGRRIRHLRWRRGVTQMELADSIGVSLRDVVFFEAGVRSVPISLLVRLANNQDVPVSYFTGRNESEDTEQSGARIARLRVISGGKPNSC